MNAIDILNELKTGGRWLGSARSWLQSNVNRGDTLTWNSGEPVTIPFCKFEEFALCVAVAAVAEDRDRMKLLPHQRSTLQKLLNVNVPIVVDIPVIRPNKSLEFQYEDNVFSMHTEERVGRTRSSSSANAFDVKQEELDAAMLELGYVPKTKSKFTDAQRMVWAMNCMGMNNDHSRNFMHHVLRVGGTGDADDCRVFIDQELEKELAKKTVETT